MPNTEVVAKAKRKRFTAAEKLRILREVEACRGSGEIGALLRREGIYSSYLTTWRKQRELGELDGLSPHKRGPKPNPEAIQLAKLRREHERLQERMRRAELIKIGRDQALLFSTETEFEDSSFHCRLLGPEIGVNEDPPIGSSVPSFAGYLCELAGPEHHFAAERGAGKFRRSLLHVRAEKRGQRSVAVRVGGTAVLISDGHIYL
jgi:transposase-like protein